VRTRYPQPPASAVSIEIEIPFHDVDFLQLVWHGHYCKYLELARTALVRSCGLDAPQMIALGYRFVVAETHLRHLGPLRYAERLRVTCWLTELESRLRMAYDLFNLSAARRCAVAETVIVTTTAAGELCLATPEPLVRLLGPVAPAGPPPVRR